MNESLELLFPKGVGVITEAEACVFLKICRRTAARLRAQRKIGYYEDGRMISYGKHHIQAYLAKREVKSS